MFSKFLIAAATELRRQHEIETFLITECRDSRLYAVVERFQAAYPERWRVEEIRFGKDRKGCLFEETVIIWKLYVNERRSGGMADAPDSKYDSTLRRKPQKH